MRDVFEVLGRGVLEPLFTVSYLSPFAESFFYDQSSQQIVMNAIPIVQLNDILIKKYLELAVIGECLNGISMVFHQFLHFGQVAYLLIDGEGLNKSKVTFKSMK